MSLDSARPWCLALLSACIVGCASAAVPARGPETSPPPREPDRPSTVSAPKPTSLFTYRGGSYAYDLLQTTTVTVASESGASVEDTLRTVAGLTYSIPASVGGPGISVTIDSLIIVSLRDSMVPARRLAAPVLVQLPLSSPPIATASDSAVLLSTCDALEEAARVLAGDVHIQIPVVMERGQRWSDSTSLVICRGGIPMTGTRISHYQVTDVRESRDTAVARVSRQTNLTISGTGAQGARQITVRGHGTSDTVFSFDLTAGRFLESTGQSVLQLGFETIQQTDQVVQRSTSSVRLRAAAPSGGP